MSDALEHFVQFFRQRVNSPGDNHFGSLGLRFISAEVGKAVLDLPYSEKLVANPATGAMAGGAIVALLDTTCAVAAATAQEAIRFCPTLDLRIDHLRQAQAGQSVRAEAKVYRLTRGVIFTEALAYHDGERDRPIARCLVNFTPVDHTVVDLNRAQSGGQPS